MTNKTEGVKILVQDVLHTLPEPYDEDIILRVCQAIENNSDWLRRYNELHDDLGELVVNSWIGKYVKDARGFESLREVSAEGRSRIIANYTKLGRNNI